jgi:hypothetical protein
MDVSISELVGKTLVSVEKHPVDELIFTCDTGEKYRMYHAQDCCESVTIDDINGDLETLVGSPILMAEEVSNEEFVKAYESRFHKIDGEYFKKDNDGNYMPDSYTWTFYRFATIKGYIDIRWFGESNGYYSESVNFEKIGKPI